MLLPAVYEIFTLLHIFANTYCSCHAAFGVLVPPPGIEPLPPALKAQSLKHWTTRKVLLPTFLTLATLMSVKQHLMITVCISLMIILLSAFSCAYCLFSLKNVSVQSLTTPPLFHWFVHLLIVGLQFFLYLDGASLVAHWWRTHLPCQCRRCWFDRWAGKIPGEGNGNPIQCSCLGNPMDRGAWRAAVH